MSILFEFWGSVKPSDAPEFASEKVCHPLRKSEITKHNIVNEGLDFISLDFEKASGKFVELKPGAYTDEEYKRIMSGDTMALDFANYGIKWRLWDGGKPYAEQMAATEWEV